MFTGAGIWLQSLNGSLASIDLGCLKSTDNANIRVSTYTLQVIPIADLFCNVRF
jgi:hypothetical protein